MRSYTQSIDLVHPLRPHIKTTHWDHPLRPPNETIQWDHPMRPLNETIQWDHPMRSPNGTTCLGHIMRPPFRSCSSHVSSLIADNPCGTVHSGEHGTQFDHYTGRCDHIDSLTCHSSGRSAYHDLCSRMYKRLPLGASQLLRKQKQPRQ